MNLRLKFHKDLSFRCGDISKTIQTFKNHQFSMYFAYFHRFAPPKSSKMDNYWMVMEFFGNKISKCPSLMEKSAPVLGHRLLPSLSNKQLIINTFLRSPCIFNSESQSSLVNTRQCGHCHISSPWWKGQIIEN